MPLFKRSPFPLAEPPKDLEPRELIFQVRFTKEIFRDYKYPFLFVFYLFCLFLLLFVFGCILVFTLIALFSVFEKGNEFNENNTISFSFLSLFSFLPVPSVSMLNMDQ